MSLGISRRSRWTVSANLGIYFDFLLVIPGIFLTLRWMVSAQAAAIENEGWMPALSWTETRSAIC